MVLLWYFFACRIKIIEWAILVVFDLKMRQGWLKLLSLFELHWVSPKIAICGQPQSVGLYGWKISTILLCVQWTDVMNHPWSFNKIWIIAVQHCFQISWSGVKFLPVKARTSSQLKICANPFFDKNNALCLTVPYFLFFFETLQLWLQN